MLLNACLGGRTIVGVFVVGATTGLLMLAATAPASAEPPPNCTPADRAGVAAGVQAATSVYLFTHPGVNAFLTGLAGQPVDQVQSQVQAFLDGDPQTKAEIQAVRQPMTDFQTRCGVEPGAS